MKTLLSTEKPKRDGAFRLVRRLYEGGELTEREMCLLVNYFMPGVTKGKPTSLFAWLSLAVATKDYRQALNYVSSIDGEIYASDGHRLHWAVAPEWAGTERAYWAPSSLEQPLKMDLGGVSPINFTNVIQGNVPTKWYQYNPKTDHNIMSDSGEALVQLVGMDSGFALQRTYWNACINGLTGVFYGATDRGVRGYGTLKGQQVNFIVMGV